MSQRPMLESLTGLRFFAALLIFFHHAWGYTQYPSLLPIWPSFEADHVAVGFFFMLSGFVLTWSSVADTPKVVLIGRRIARVYPLHLLALAFAVVVLTTTQKQVEWIATPASFVLLQAWFPDPIRYAINGPAWSISAELFFYLLFPFIVASLIRIRRWKIALTIIVLLMVVIAAGAWLLAPDAADFLAYTFPPFRIGEFLIGILLAAAMRRGWRHRIRVPIAVGVALVGLSIFTALVTVLGDVIPRGTFVVASIPSEALLITSAAQADLSGRRGFLGSRALIALGNWSFAFYLLHLSVLIALRPYAHGPVTTVVVLSIALVVTMLMSAGVHHWFERPVERRIRGWVENRWGAVRPSS